jgi:hypothetical protein
MAGMSFSLAAWAIGYGLSSASKWASSEIFSDALARKLDRTVEAWASALPDGVAVYPAALFDAGAAPDSSSPCRERLGKTLLDRRIPTEEEWFDAFLERWEAVKRRIGKEAQSLFLLPEDEAAPLLRLLARQVVDVCRADQDMFRISTAEKIDELLAQVRSASAPTLDFAKQSGDDRRDLHMPIITALFARRNDEAEQLARIYLKQFPRSARAHYSLAVALTRQAADAKEPASSARVQSAGEHLERAVEFNLLWLLRVHEGVADPVEYVLGDPDLAYLFGQRPDLKRVPEQQRRQFQPMMGARSYGYAGCFAGESRIRRADGTLTAIRDLRVGDEVWTASGEEGGIGRVVARGAHAAFPLVLNGGIRVSPTQPLRTASGRWHTAGELTPGDRVATDSGEALDVHTVVTSAAAEIVYWLEVEPHHTFSADGLVAHNKYPDWKLLDP